MAEFVELTFDGYRRALRVDRIVAVAENENNLFRHVFLDGDCEPWHVEETYDEIMRKIKEETA